MSKVRKPSYEEEWKIGEEWKSDYKKEADEMYEKPGLNDSDWQIESFPTAEIMIFIAICVNIILFWIAIDSWIKWGHDYSNYLSRLNYYLEHIGDPYMISNDPPSLLKPYDLIWIILASFSTLITNLLIWLKVMQTIDNKMNEVK